MTAWLGHCCLPCGEDLEILRRDFLAHLEAGWPPGGPLSLCYPHPLPTPFSYNSSGGSNSATQPYLSAQLRCRSLN